MAHLLHLDSSIFPGGASASRSVTQRFRQTWQDQHPLGTVTYRDLATHPVPHISADVHNAALAAPGDRSPAVATRIALIEELEEADAVLIGAPMYNYGIPSTLKAWLDNIVLVGRTAPATNPKLGGKPVTIVASRGGAYGPGSPRAGYDYVQNYLTAVLADTLGLRLDFIVAELTRAPVHLVPLYEASRARALACADLLASAGQPVQK